MADAASMVSSGELTRAVRDARTPAGVIHEGDWLGVVDGTVTVIGPSGRGSGLRRRLERWVVGSRRAGARLDRRAESAEIEALVSLLEAVVQPRHEIVTVFTGDGSRPGVTLAATEWLSEHRPGATVQVADGGQPLYPYLIGAE
jgi:dihydroxyacetone kinase-like predicted kinase